MIQTEETRPLDAWTGREETAVDTLSPQDAHKLAATLRCSERLPGAGQPMPALWHWCCFPAVADGRDLGVDGHPARGGFLPPVALPRRMWAAGDVVFHRAPRVGETLHRLSRVDQVQHKQGRSGALVFVTVRHEVRAGSGTASEPAPLCISERQDIVYRGPDTESPRAQPPFAPEDEHWRETVRPDPVMLFRYSALTFNGHRIHYDRDYATGAEGYPGLVVHGPLLATLLASALERRLQGRPIVQFAFKAVRPAFDGDLVTLCGRDDGDGRFTLWARNEMGHLAMSATART